MRSKQSGFTLVEIAIVLVIIGLLLGGVLKGQELINSAKVKNMIASDFRDLHLRLRLPGSLPLPAGRRRTSQRQPRRYCSNDAGGNAGQCAHQWQLEQPDPNR
jgi:prepilin-type N-terminal cleavage/methylation domain-containing protein